MSLQICLQTWRSKQDNCGALWHSRVRSSRGFDAAPVRLVLTLRTALRTHITSAEASCTEASPVLRSPVRAVCRRASVRQRPSMPNLPPKIIPTKIRDFQIFPMDMRIPPLITLIMIYLKSRIVVRILAVDDGCSCTCTRACARVHVHMHIYA